MSHGTFFTAPTYPNIGGKDRPVEPLIFLAGPIQGAPDWQQPARDLIMAADSRIHVASPRRPFRHEGDFTDAMYREQVAWEHYHLRYAAGYGVTLFWLANEETHYPDRAYAQTTRFELGEAMMRNVVLGARVAVGFDTSFSNAKYLRLTLAKKAPDIPLCDSLEATCAKAVELIQTMYPPTSVSPLSD
jgi:hypothetical protein